MTGDGELVSLMGTWVVEEAGDGGGHLLDQLDQAPVQVYIHHFGPQKIVPQLLTGVLV